MADIRRIPFSEMVERIQKDLVRDNATSNGKYEGRINDMYQTDIPPQLDWRHVRKQASVTTTEYYATGYITDISGTTVTGDSDALWTSANSNNMLLSVSGCDEIYRVTYVSATELTLDRTWVEDDISSTDTSYQLVQDRYQLADDFDRMILDPNRSVYHWGSGNRVYLTYRDPDEFEELQVSDYGTPSYYTVKWVSGDPFIFIDPPDDEARTINYTYMPSIRKMFEYTTGTISTLANGSASVTGSGSAWSVNITDTTNYDYYFRIDGDGTGGSSKWYKILSIDGATTLTLASNYLGTSISGGSSTYTISAASTLPPGLDVAIMYGAAIVSAGDQANEKQTKTWSALYTRAIDQYKAIESKKNYGLKRMKTIYARPGVRR